jgi:hypothetical protein
LGVLLLVTVLLAGGGCPFPFLNVNPVVSLSVQNAMVTEESGIVTITAELDSRALRPVTVQLAFSGTAEFDVDYQASATSITIPAGQSSGSITLAAIPDDIYEGNETILIDIVGEDGQQVTARIQDSGGQPRASLGLTGSPLVEDGGVATVTVTLSWASAFDTTINLGFSGTAATTDYTHSAAQVVVAAGQMTGSITLTGVDDDVYEGDETVIVDITGVTNGTENGAQRVTATIQENDAQPTASLGLTGSPLAENGGVATVTVTLSRVSVLSTTVNLGFAGTASTADYSRSAAQVVIAAGQTTGTITLTGTEDNIHEADETIVVDITTVVNGTENGEQQVTATIQDDDAEPTVSLSVTGSPLTENGGVATVTATLSNPSYQDVTVHLGVVNDTASDSDYTVAGNPITIPAGSLTGSATVTGVNDTLDEDDVDETLTVSITSVTNGTESGNQEVTVAIADDDAAPLVTLGADPLTLAENGGTSTVTATLAAPSGQSVVVDLAFAGTAADPADYGVSATQITIAAGDITGSVTVTAVDNVVSDGNRTVIASISGVSNGTEDGEQSVTLQITDDEAAGVTVSPLTITVVEGGAGVSFDVVLDVEPTADVTVTVTTDPQVSLDLATLTFTNGNWDQVQSVTVTAIDDGDAEGPYQGTIALAAAGGGYDGVVISSVTVNVIDDDTAAGVTITQSGGSTAVGEPSGTDTYTVVLAAQPTTDVAIALAVNNGHVTVDPATLTFTSANWDQAQTVTVTVVDNFVADGTRTSVISHTVTSGDTRYNGLAVSNVTSDVSDNDVAGVDPSTSSVTVAEGGAAGSYTIVLASQPTADVDVTVTPDAQVDLGSGAGVVVVLTFTDANWDTPQTVSVTAVDDGDIEGVHTGTITHAAASTDPKYNGIAIVNVTVNITDND